MTPGPQDSTGGNRARLPQRNEKGADLATNWLGELGIYDGEWFTASKPKLQRGMRARCFSEAGRIWCCLGLQTECFQQELAVKLVAGKRVPLQPVDVAAMTGIRKQHIRRGVLQLKAWGLADIQGEEHHRVRLYAWVRPRPLVDDPEANAARDPWSGVPQEWKRYFRRFKIQPADGFEFVAEYLQDLDSAARGYVKSIEVLKSVLARSRAGDPIQRNRNEPENTQGSSSVSQSPDRLTDPLTEAEDMHNLLIEEMGDKLPGEEPTRTLCLRLVQILGEADWHLLRLKIRHRLNIVTSMGAAEGFAREVRRRWDTDAVARRKQEAQQAKQQRARDIEFAYEVLRNPEADDEQKVWAHEVLGMKADV
jgi:hypothetical protein